MTWKTIDSAPRDGTRILIAGGTFELGWDDQIIADHIEIAFWHTDHWHGPEANAHDEWQKHRPTHWQPLPAPPSHDGSE